MASVAMVLSSAVVLLLALLTGSSTALSPLTEMLNEVVRGTLYALETGSGLPCQQAVAEFHRAEKLGSAWALQVRDSIGIPSTGIMKGGVSSLGYFSECISAKFENENFTLENQFCLSKITFSGHHKKDPLKKISKNAWDIISRHPAQIALCLPQSCSRKEILAALKRAAKPWVASVELENCTDGRSSFYDDTPALITSSVFGLVILLSVIGTLYEGIFKKDTLKVCTSLCRTNTHGTSSEVLYETTCDLSSSLCGKNKEAEKMRQSLFVKFLCAFSILSNGRKILSTAPSENNIAVLNGIRFFSMVWIILGHTYSFGMQWLTFRNPGEMMEAPKDLLTQAFSNGTFSVDTFFFLCGVLVSMHGNFMLKKANGSLNLVKFYFHRYLRLTPLMMAVIAFCAFILRHVANGPKWLSTIEGYDLWCRKNWWTNMIYMQNFIHREQMCLSHTWYSAVDFQIYLVSPLLIYAFYKGPRWYLPIWFVFFIGTTITTAMLTAIYNLPAVPYFNNITPQSVLNDYFAMIYIKPYCRMGPFLIGMALGYFFTKAKCVTLRKKYVFLFWILCITSILAVLFGMYPANQGNLPSSDVAATYSSLARSVWSVCLAWIVLACVSGYGGFVNTILSWPALIPLSRLTYCAYLIHPVIMSTFYGSREIVIDFNSYFMIYIVIGNLVLTYIASFFISLLFESPIIRLEKIFSR